MKAMAGKGIGEDDKGLEWVRSEVITGLECRAVMKRLSKDNYKEKVSFSDKRRSFETELFVRELFVATQYSKTRKPQLNLFRASYSQK